MLVARNSTIIKHSRAGGNVCIRPGKVTTSILSIIMSACGSFLLTEKIKACLNCRTSVNVRTYLNCKHRKMSEQPYGKTFLYSIDNKDLMK